MFFFFFLRKIFFFIDSIINLLRLPSPFLHVFSIMLIILLQVISRKGLSTSNTKKEMSHLLHLFLLILHLPWIYKTNLSIILNQSSVVHHNLHNLPTDIVFLIPSLFLISICLYSSSTEGKHRLMSSACSEIVWLRRLLDKLGLPQNTSTPLHADNTNAIQIPANHVFYEQSKRCWLSLHLQRKRTTRPLLWLKVVFIFKLLTSSPRPFLVWNISSLLAN